MIEDWLGLSPPLLWGMVAILLAIAELVAPGVFLIWLSLAAALTATLTLLMPVAEPFQLVAFAIFAALAVSGGRLWYLARPVEPQDKAINDPAARLIGRQVVVVEPIVGGEGRVRLADSTWSATGPDAPAGAIMQVTDVAGSTLGVAYPVLDAD